jgi:hypothetical protein
MPRFTIDMDTQAEATLRELAEGGTKADVIRRALNTYKALKNEIGEGPGETKYVSITNAAGQIEKTFILP